MRNVALTQLNCYYNSLYYYFYYYFSPPQKKKKLNNFFSNNFKNLYTKMEDIPGSLGTSASLALRMGQTLSALASLIIMCFGFDFYTYPVYCFMIAVLGVVVPWSMTLAMVDMIAVFIARPARPRGMIAVTVVGDWVLSFLSLAGACSSASVTSYMHNSEKFCGDNLCTRFQLASAMALVTWFLLFASALSNMWLLPSLP